jgi:hypothetical protein
MDQTLLARIADAMEQLARVMRELVDEPALAGNLHWRDNLETTGYQIMTALSTDDE